MSAGKLASVGTALGLLRRKLDEIVLVVDTATGVETGLTYSDDDARARVHRIVLDAQRHIYGAECELEELQRDREPRVGKVRDDGT